MPSAPLPCGPPYGTKDATSGANLSLPSLQHKRCHKRCHSQSPIKPPLQGRQRDRSPQRDPLVLFLEVGRPKFLLGQLVRNFGKESPVDLGLFRENLQSKREGKMTKKELGRRLGPSTRHWLWPAALAAVEPSNPALAVGGWDPLCCRAGDPQS